MLLRWLTKTIPNEPTTTHPQADLLKDTPLCSSPMNSPHTSPSGAWSQKLAPVVITPGKIVPDETPDLAQPICKAKVLHLVNGEHFSGAERVQSHLGRCLPTFGVTADFVSVKPGMFAEMLDAKNGEWGVGYRAEMANRFDLRVVRKIQQLAKANQYELVHAHTPRTAMIAAIACQFAKIPWVYHVHSPASRDSNRSLTNHLNAAIEKFSLRNCQHLITVSESLRLDCIRRGADQERVTVVHNGVPGVRPPRESTPTVGSRWTLGMIALQRPRKGLEIALQAVAALKSKFDLLLRIIGPFETDHYESEIFALIDELQIRDNIERVGFTDDVPAELSKLDAMVLPSLFGEGLPMVVLEAMAAAVPVIATRVEGTPEAVTDGVEGLLAEPRDSESFAEKIAELVSGKHDWTTMSEAAYERHARDFSDTAMAGNTAKVYAKALGR